MNCTFYNGEILYLSDAFCALAELIDEVYFVLLAISVLVLVWGIFKFITNAGDPSARSEARSFILWAVIGIFVMTSIWGVVNILYNTVSVDRRPVDTSGTSIIPGYIPSDTIPDDNPH